MSLYIRRFTPNGTIKHTKYFCLMAEDDNVTFTITIGSAVTTSNFKYLEYSTDQGKTWTKTNNSGSTRVTITTPPINHGQTVLLRGEATKTSRDSGTTNVDWHTIIGSNGKFNARGCITTLLYGKNANENTNIIENWTFAFLFYNNTQITDAHDLIMPPNVTVRCYSSMFNGCSNLTRTPLLPAETLQQQCYMSMFNGCTKLKEVRMMATDISANGCMTTWIPASRPNLQFYRNPNATWWRVATSGLPQHCILFDSTEADAEEETFIDPEVQRIAIANFGNRIPPNYCSELTANTNVIWKGTIRIGGVDGKVLKRQIANIIKLNNQFANNSQIVDCSDFNKFVNLKEFFFINSNSYPKYKRFGFYNSTSLKYVTLPNSMTKLGSGNTYEYGCFQGTAIETITIPNSVTECGNKPFYNCTSLTSVTWSNNLPVYLSASRCENVFSNCTKLESIFNFPQTSTMICPYHFYNCSKLDMTPIIPLFATITSLGQYAFYGCANTNLPNELVFPKVTNNADWMMNGFGRRKLYFPKKTQITVNSCAGNNAELIDLGNITGTYFYPGSGNTTAQPVTVVLRSTAVPTFTTFNKNYVRRIYVYSSILDDFKADAKCGTAASITFAIGGTEWIEDFGSSDEWADYPNGQAPTLT